MPLFVKHVPKRSEGRGIQISSPIVKGAGGIPSVTLDRRDLIHATEVVKPKEDVHLTASIGRNRPIADIRLRKVSHSFLPQAVHFALTSNIESITEIHLQHKAETLN